MKIGINLIPFSRIQGTEVYTKNLLSSLLELEEEIDFVIFATEDLPEILDFPEVEVVKIEGLNSKYSKALCQQFNIYRLLNKHEVNLLFSPSPIAPFFYGNKVVVIHDCGHERLFGLQGGLNRIYFRAMVYGARFFSKKIISVSKFTKRELMELYNIDPQKIEVIHEGPPKLEKTEEKFDRKTLNKFQIDPPYFFYIGVIRPGKNIPRMLEAFKIFSERNPDFKLVLAGETDKSAFDVKNKIEKLELRDKVVLPGFVSEKEKTSLYKKSAGLVFPSLYEGFGLPVLEAQNLGIPVVTSDTTSLPEIAKGSALLVDPYNVHDIAKGMNELASNEKLRENLVKNGLENVKRFSWQKAAQETVRIFKDNKVK